MKKLSLFAAYGVELEYMIVQAENLSVCPISDQLIFEVTGQFQNEIEFGAIAWSNELVLHVIELKTNGPAPSLLPLANYFHQEVQHLNQLLVPHQALLLPTGAHPWMNPYTQAKLWPHDQNIIYETYHKIFDCRGHGWSNLQSVHLNLPFANDDEFAKLHTAIRLVLPILPALTASTPIIDGKLTGILDNRLDFYRTNQRKIPEVTGLVIPELMLSQQEYQEKILEKMYRAVAPYDSDKVLQEEWLNSRGAIARFDRNTIEIRIIDSQECPAAELAIISVVVALLKCLIAEKWQSFTAQTAWSEQQLQPIFLSTVTTGMATPVDKAFTKIFGFEGNNKTVRDLWRYLLNEVAPLVDQPSLAIVEQIVNKGNLAERIITALQNTITQPQLLLIYQQLAHCLQQNKLFLP